MALILLLTINLFNYIDRQVLASVVDPIGSEFFDNAGDETAKDQYAEAKLGTLQTAFMVTYMLLAPIFGWLADRFSRWLLIGVGVVLWSLASGASGWAPTHLAFLASPFIVLLVTRCFVGVGEAAYGPAAPTIISDLYPVAARGQVLAWFYAAIPVGSALGYELGGAVLKITGEWRWAFYVVVPPGLLLGLWCFLMREPPRGQADAGMDSKRQARWGDYLTLLRTPSYVLDTLGMTAMTFAMGGIAFWMPRYILRYKQLPAMAADTLTQAAASPILARINLLFGIIVVVAGLVATLLGGIVGDRLRTRFPGAYFLVSGLAMLVGFPMVLAVIWLPHPYYWYFIAGACFCLFFNTGPTNTILANVTHPAIRASAFALNILVIHTLGDAISPALIGLISSLPHCDMNVGFLVVSGMFLVGGLLWLWGARFLARDTAMAPHRLQPKL
jgi:MFS family permease